MSKKEIEKFNMLFEELLDKMVEKFKNKKLNSYRRFFILMKTTMPKVPVNIFMSGCIAYKDKIKSRDVNFFLEDDTIYQKTKYFGNFTKDCGVGDYWSSMSLSTQSAIWDYIQSLFVLGEIIINNNKDLFEKYNKFYLSDFKDDINNINNSSLLLTKLNS